MARAAPSQQCCCLLGTLNVGLILTPHHHDLDCHWMGLPLGGPVEGPWLSQRFIHNNGPRCGASGP